MFAGLDFMYLIFHNISDFLLRLLNSFTNNNNNINSNNNNKNNNNNNNNINSNNNNKNNNNNNNRGKWVTTRFFHQN